MECVTSVNTNTHWESYPDKVFPRNGRNWIKLKQLFCADANWQPSFKIYSSML